jgi:hypothetical protein
MIERTIFKIINKISLNTKVKILLIGMFFDTIDFFWKMNKVGAEIEDVSLMILILNGVNN